MRRTAPSEAKCGVRASTFWPAHRRDPSPSSHVLPVPEFQAVVDLGGPNRIPVYYNERNIEYHWELSP